MSRWSTFAQVCGDAAGALIGLLFVAVSIRIESIAQSQALRNRAAQTLSLFGAVLLVAILIAIPGQATEALGAELTVLGIVAAVGLSVLARRARTIASSQPIARTLDLITPNTVVSSLLMIAGVLLLCGLPGGIYVLVFPVIAAFASGITSAWLLLIKIPGQPSPPHSQVSDVSTATPGTSTRIEALSRSSGPRPTDQP